MEKMRPTFSRRGMMRQAAAIVGGGAIVAAGLGQGFASAQGAKIAPAVAKYQTTPKGKAQCSTCSSFIAPGSCKVVSGEISPSGWCSLYSAKA